jgi:hypothetical protein
MGLPSAEGGSAPGSGDVEGGDGSEAREGLEAGATDHRNGDGAWLCC